MTKKAKEPPLIQPLNDVLSESEYIEQKATRLAKEIMERKARGKKQ